MTTDSEHTPEPTMNETLKNIKAILTGMRDTLTERERQVLEQRFGLVDGYSRTLEEVSRQFKTTTARIKEIEVRALAKMLGSMKRGDNTINPPGPDQMQRRSAHPCIASPEPDISIRLRHRGKENKIDGGESC